MASVDLVLGNVVVEIASIFPQGELDESGRLTSPSNGLLHGRDAAAASHQHDLIQLQVLIKASARQSEMSSEHPCRRNQYLSSLLWCFLCCWRHCEMQSTTTHWIRSVTGRIASSNWRRVTVTDTDPDPDPDPAAPESLADAGSS